MMSLSNPVVTHLKVKFESGYLELNVKLDIGLRDGDVFVQSDGVGHDNEARGLDKC